MDKRKTMKFRYTAGVAVTFVFLLLAMVFHKVNAEPEIPRISLSVIPLNLSRPPTTQEIMSAGQLGGPLYPTHDMPDRVLGEKINLSFGEAIQLWNKHEYTKAVELFWKHIAEYPNSPWASEAILHIGCDAQYHGRYSEAEGSFQRVLEENKARDTIGAKMLVNKAKLRMGNQKALQNNFDVAMRYFKELKSESTDWRDSTYASHWIQRLSKYKATKVNMLDCGVRALARVLKKDGKEAEAIQVSKMLPASQRGHSIKNLRGIAGKYGYNLVGLRLSVSDLKKIPLPAIVQLSGREEGDMGHYWVLESLDKDGVTLFDPQSERIFQQSTQEFSREWGGNIMVFSNKKDLPGVRLTRDETGQIYGGCCGVSTAESDLGPQKDAECDGSDCECEAKGSPKWDVNMVNMNLFVTDTPLWYSPSIGPRVSITLSYNAQSAIAQHEPFGNKWQFNYASYLVADSGGQVTIFMPGGRRDVYPPDGKGGYKKPYQVFNTLTKTAENHFELRFPDDTVYVYNIPTGTKSLQPFLVEIRDPHSQKLTFGYDSDVRLSTITDAMGQTTHLTYNTQGQVTKVADPFGRSAAFEYDANHNLTKLTDMGGYWSGLTYDKNVYITSIADERGKRGFYIEPADGIDNGGNEYPPPGGIMDEDYRITTTDPLGGKAEYYYDAGCDAGYGWYVSPRDYISYTTSEDNRSAVKTAYYYVEGGSRKRGEIRRITTPLRGGVVYDYDHKGNRIGVTDANGNSIKYTYNDMGRVTSVTDAKGHVTTMVYAGNGVDLLEAQNGLGSVKMTYNGAHDVTSLTDRLGNTTTIAYNSYGQETSRTNALGVVTTYLYDDSHNLLQVTSDGQILGKYTYDAIGRVKTHTDATGVTLTYEYNDLDNVVKTIYPDGKFISYTYSSCCPYMLDSETDRSGLTTSYVYDANKRLTETVNQEGGVASYAYDANGNRTILTDPRNNVTIFTYDLLNRPVKKTYANGKSVSFAYDGVGKLKKYTDARGRSASYTYDKNYNILTMGYSDGTPGVTCQYDDYDRMISRTDGIGTWQCSYDANSQLISVDGPWADDTITYQYDVLGRRKGLTPQKGQAVSYTYNTLNRLTGIQAGSGAYAYTYTDANPLIQSFSRPDKGVTAYQYDSLARLTSVFNKDSSGAIISEYAYTYDNQDLRASETTTGAKPITSFQNELVTYNYNRVNQLLSSQTPLKTFTYDADGNMTQGYTPEGYLFTAAYDARGHLVSVEYTDKSKTSHKTEYRYGGDNFLTEVKHYENGSLVSDTRFVREGPLVLQERDASNNVTKEYTWGLGMGGGIGGLLNLREGGQDYAYLYDGKGNVTALLDSSQTLAATYAYDTFGNLMYKTGSLDQPYRFSTKPYDEKTGLSYYGHRFYSPAIGRWITRDPLGEAGGMNLYGFVGNTPINNIDSLGLIADHETKYDSKIYFLSEGKPCEKPEVDIRIKKCLEDNYGDPLSEFVSSFSIEATLESAEELAKEIYDDVTLKQIGSYAEWEYDIASMAKTKAKKKMSKKMAGAGVAFAEAKASKATWGKIVKFSKFAEGFGTALTVAGTAYSTTAYLYCFLQVLSQSP